MYKLAGALALAFFGFILWVIYMANTGVNSVFFEFIAEIPYGDKLGHFCLFGFLTLGANVGLKFKCLKFKFLVLGQTNIYLGTSLVLVFVLLEELSQGFIASRTFDLKDLIADGVGISLFTLVSYGLSKICIARGE